MIPANIITGARDIAKADTSQFSDTKALFYLNLIKDEFWTAILSNVPLEFYNWNEWKVDTTVAYQSEYTLPTMASTTAWVKIVNGVAICYDGETYPWTNELKYVKCRPVDRNDLPNDWSYYVVNQSENDPIYTISDKSVFIAPAPKTGLVNGYKVNGVQKIADYTIGTTEAEMRIPLDQQKAMVYGLAVWAHFCKGSDDSIINNAEARWGNKQKEAISSLESRDVGTAYFKYPDDISPDELP